MQFKTPARRSTTSLTAKPTGPARKTAQTHIGVLIGQSPLLMQLTQHASLSSQLLDCIRASLPAPLRAAIQAGPVEGHEWCLIVPNSAAAAKLRHLSPRLIEVLQEQNPGNRPAITHIRLRISAASS